jgi:hypothetical protein
MDKRREKRYRARIPLEITAGARSLKGITQNLSRMGAYAQVDEELSVGEEIIVSLCIPAHNTRLTQAVVKCKGQVFRCNVLQQQDKRVYGAGIFFVGFESAEEKDLLSGFVDYLMLKEEELIQQGAHTWHQRQKKEQEASASTGADDSQVIALLHKVLQRLDEIEQRLNSNKA